MSVTEIGTRGSVGTDTAGASMLAAQLDAGAPWANEVMNVGTLRRQIANQVMQAEEVAFKARKAEEAALHRQQVAAAKAHNAITQNLMATVGAAQTAVGANKFLGKMKATLEKNRGLQAAPMEGQVKLQDIRDVREARHEAGPDSESAATSEKWRTAKRVPTQTFPVRLPFI